MDTDEQRFTHLYQQHYEKIRQFLVRRVSDVEASDLVADVFTVAWRRFAEVPAGAELPWLYGVARFVLANEVRGQQRTRRLAERAAAEPAGSNASDHADGVASRLDVAAAFDRLSPADQEVLRLVAWEQLGPSAAARALGCSRATFAMRLLRARRRLRRHMGAPPRQGDEVTENPQPLPMGKGGRR